MFIISDKLIPNVNTNSITAIPIQSITAPTSPKSFASGTAATAPIAPPPLLWEPK